MTYKNSQRMGVQVLLQKIIFGGDPVRVTAGCQFS